MRKSRPLTAPPSRFKKRSFPPEIIGIPTTTVSPRINSTRPLSSIQRPVSAPITPARSQYDDLSSTFDNFVEQTAVNITSPFLVAQFLRFSARFNQFCDTSSTIKNSFFGNYSKRMKINNASIIVQAQAMMNEWNDFQKFFINVKSINIVPIYKLISNCFVNLSSAINDCYDLCGVGSRFETIPKPFQKYIDEEIKLLNQVAINIYNERIKQFDPLDFYNRTIAFIQKTQSKLLTSFFKNRMSTADVMRRKMALNIAYEDLVKLLNGTQNFDLLAKEVEDQIILMNQSIGELYSSLHLPISLRKIKPIFDDEGRSLNLSILRPSTSMTMEKDEVLKESARKANKIESQTEKISFKFPLKDKNDNENNDDKTQDGHNENKSGDQISIENKNENGSQNGNETENKIQNENTNEDKNSNETENQNEKDNKSEDKSEKNDENSKENEKVNKSEKDNENSNENKNQIENNNNNINENQIEKNNENKNCIEKNNEIKNCIEKNNENKNCIEKNNENNSLGENENKD